MGSESRVGYFFAGSGFFLQRLTPTRVGCHTVVMTSHSTNNMTKAQRMRAITILNELGAIAPDLVTPREATFLCEKYGVTNDRFRRVAKAYQNFRPINLAQVAVEIAKKAK